MIGVVYNVNVQAVSPVYHDNLNIVVTIGIQRIAINLLGF